MCPGGLRDRVPRFHRRLVRKPATMTEYRARLPKVMMMRPPEATRSSFFSVSATPLLKMPMTTKHPVGSPWRRRRSATRPVYRSAQKLEQDVLDVEGLAGNGDGPEKQDTSHIAGAHRVCGAGSDAGHHGSFWLWQVNSPRCPGRFVSE
ncbi:hypothetical protein NL676_013857 [Syzygium grande]|nr:hypothetical protein NL676_013857 [Syzygium grande]